MMPAVSAPLCCEMTLAASLVCSMVFHQQTEKHQGNRQTDKLMGAKGLLHKAKALCAPVAWYAQEQSTSRTYLC